jgi:molybdopterin-guanine dinucleotide biosynthesis protein A
MVSVVGAVLVGGRSARMRRPKALLTAPGSAQTLLERTVAILRQRLSSVALLGTPPFALPESVALAGLLEIPDRPHVGGPLAAMLGAFDARARVAWLIAACDLPLVEPGAIDWLLAQRRSDRLAVLPRLRAGSREIEPLLAVYEPAARPLLERLAAEPAGASRSLQRLFGLPGVASPRVPAALRSCWTNVNSPDDWARLNPPPTQSRPRPRAQPAPARRRR